MVGTGWVYREGIQGGWGEGYTGTQPLCSRRVLGQRSGPGSPCRGLEWWSQEPDVPVAPGDHPCGARSALRPSLSPPRANPASWPIRARIGSHLLKVSQNSKVSPKYVEKASRSPCFHFRAQKSPLEILRFPFSRAFSHKELMGLF